MRMTKEEFCKKFELTEEQFYGEIFCKNIIDAYLEYLPEGCTLNTTRDIYLTSLKELPLGCTLKANHSLYLISLKKLPEGCTLKADYINLHSLKKLPENCSIEAELVYCSIVLPTYKGSSEFYYGNGFWSKKYTFEEYSYIKESPLKFLKSDSELERALVEYFLKESF